MRSLAIGLMVAGLLLIVAGGAVWLAWRLNLPLGRLPGDLRWEGKGWSFYFPILTCIILSILLTVLVNLFFRR